MNAQQAPTRENLERRLAELVARDAALEKHLRGADGRLDADFSDRVAYTEMDEVIEQLDVEARAEITAIRGALKRLEDGTFGTCTGCGEAIPTARLAALPHTAVCVGCAD